MLLMAIIAVVVPFFVLTAVKAVGKHQIAMASPGQPRYFAMRAATNNYRVTVGVIVSAYAAVAWYVMFF